MHVFTIENVGIEVPLPVDRWRSVDSTRQLTGAALWLADKLAEILTAARGSCMSETCDFVNLAKNLKGY